MLAVTTKATICFSDSGFTLATCANVCVAVVRRPLTVEKTRRLRQELEKLDRQFGQERIALSIVEPEAVASPDPQLRSEYIAIGRDFPVAQNVIVLEGTGFRIAAGRAIMNGLAFLSGKGARQQTFVSVEPALDSIRTHGHARGLTHADLVALVSTARAAQ
jgi:hypothetical protein